MSLYGGIKFATGEAESSAPGQEGNGSNHAGPSNHATTAQSVPKASTGYSAALKFAPRIPKPKPSAQTPRPLSNYTAAPVIEKQPDLLRSTSAEDDVPLGADGKPLAKAPAMTLIPDIRAKGAQGSKRDRVREEERKRKKKKRQKQRQQQQYISNFDPDDMYDPNRPNDLGEYQQYRKRLRAEKRAQALADKLRRERGGRSSDESSYYTDSEDEAPRRDAPRMFAPPRQYSPPPSVAALPPSIRRDPSPPPSAYVPPPPPSLPHDAPPPPPASGEDAYARRAAMAQTQAVSGDDAYARRAALGQPQSGDDAYARRAAMGAQAGKVPSITAETSAIPVSAPASYAASGSIPPGPSVLPSTNSANALHASSAIPGFSGYHPSTSANPPAFAASMPLEAAPNPSAPAPASSTADSAAKTLEARMAAAAAIAAKYAHLAPGPAMPPVSAAATTSVTPIPRPSVVPREEETGTFAEKMMKRWGHVEGTGIGARADGIVHALAAEHVQKQLDPAKMSKRQVAKQKAAAANAKKRKWVQAPNARGKIVNANEDVRAAAERDKLGDASRIVCLVGLVESEEEVDEELSDEIGEECSKWGIVERVVLHMVEPPPEEPGECLRVFVVFSGLAGAWRATKELDGRFFGGRKIAAKYFDEGRFDSGDRDGPIVT